MASAVSSAVMPPKKAHSDGLGAFGVLGGEIREGAVKIDKSAAIVNGMAKRSHDAATNGALLEAFDQNVAASREVLGAASDEHLTATVPQLNMTRQDLLRERMMSHMIRDRGQLTVYLRLLDVAVPGMYGPSADEK